MAAAAGLVTFLDYQGNRISKSVYFDDTAGNRVRWQAGGAKASATSAEYYTPSTIVKLVDMVMDGATGKTMTQIQGNDMDTGQMLLNSNHLASITTRPVLGIGWFKPGTRISLVQIA